MESTSKDNPPKSYLWLTVEQNVEQEQFLHLLLHWPMIFIAGLDNRRLLRTAALKVSPTAQIRGDGDHIGEKSFSAEFRIFLLGKLVKVESNSLLSTEHRLCFTKCIYKAIF